VEITSIPGCEGATSAGVIRGFSVRRAAIGTAIDPPGRGLAEATAGTDATKPFRVSRNRSPVFGQVNSVRCPSRGAASSCDGPVSCAEVHHKIAFLYVSQANENSDA
jgi:hypothetical protein